MDFFTFSNEPRPVRLCEETRLFAYESLNERKYGLDTKKTPAAILDNIDGLDEMSDIEKYNICISEIVSQAPIRICKGERLSGAATLGLAMNHTVPATYNGKILFESVSHLTIDFDTAVKFGINKIENDVKERMARGGLTVRQTEFLNSALHCINEMRRYRKRYLVELSKMPEYKENYNNLLHVPFEPAKTFYEAVQSIWFTFAFVRLCGNWPGIGRIDQILGDYLKKDLENGTVTLDEAREIIAHFLIKGCEWVKGDTRGNGDAQHYQNLVLAGIDEDGNEVTNEVTYLILDVLEEINISDFPTTMRLNRNSPPKLLGRIADVMKHGGGVLAVYNEEKIIESLTTHGYELKEARKFANDGCWEIQVPGKTYFAYTSFDGLSVLLRDTLNLHENGAHFDSYDELKEKLLNDLERVILIIRDCGVDKRAKRTANGAWEWNPQTPCTVVSLFEGGCIEKAASYYEGGAIYNVVSPHLGGVPDIGNSLRVIDKLCFKEKKISFDDLMEILKNNWEGNEPLRQYVLNKISQYGNDDDEADAYTKDVADSFAARTLKNDHDIPFRLVPGISSFGGQIAWREHRPAAPHGHKIGEILAPNMGATPGSDTAGATALIKSYCKLNLTDQVTGAALDVKLLPSAVKGEDGKNALIALMQGFVNLGGCFMQPDVVDNEILKDAQLHPERYASLSVRVSGWNARFVTLNENWQNMVIEKTTHGEI